MTSHQGSDASLCGLPFSPATYHPSTLEESLRVPAQSLLGQGMITDATTDALSTIAVYPLALVTTRLRIQRTKRRDDRKGVNDAANGGAFGYKEILAKVREIYEKENGLKGLYAGSLEAGGKAVVDAILRFLVYATIHRRMLRLKGLKSCESLSTLNRAIVGLLAELVTVALTAPIGTIVTRKQAGDQYWKGTSKKRVKGLWAGYSASLFLTLNVPLSVFALEALKIVVFRSRNPNISASSTYLLWTISHAVASSITYPFAVLKSRAQVSSSRTRRHGTTTETELTAYHQVLRKIAQSEGPSALYPGLAAEILRFFTTYGATALFRSLVLASLPSSYHLFSTLFEGRRKHEVPDGVNEIIGKSEAEAEAAGIMVPHTPAEGSRTPQSKTEGLPGWGYMNATAELVGDYVEDEAHDWRNFYHWFWDPDWRRDGD